MTVLVTGGAGFLGTSLIRHILSPAHGGGPDTRVVCVDREPCPIDDPRVESRTGSVADPVFLRAALPRDVDVVWHLAAVLSGQSEAEPALAMAVNVGGTLALIDACDGLPCTPRFVLASTVAVFGGPLPAVVPEDFPLRPQSTYGVSKAIAELHVLEATRRGRIDGVACRVPTVAVRPGRPNSALSSFVSGIVREPVAGLASVCPVPLDTRLWVASPDTTTANLAHAARVDTAVVGAVRSIDLPGITVTPADLLAGLERLAGSDARALVRVEPDDAVAAVVNTWPGGIDVRRAIAMGFAVDRDADALVAQFLDGRPRA